MSTPTFDPDDPRLTAYALGESSPAERAAVEKLLAASPEAREEVERTRAFALALQGEYHKENEAYRDTRGSDPLPGKVIEFPVGRKPAFALVWKMAALVVALGVLITVALRPWSSPPVATLASSQRVEVIPPPAASIPPSVEATPAARALAKAEVPADANPAQPQAAAPAASRTPAGESSDTLLAMDTDRVRRDDDAPFTNSTSENRRALQPSAQRAATAPAPALSAPGGSADASSSGASAPAGRIGPSLVQIRTKNGSYIGGIAVMADGWILAAEPLSLEATPTVISANHRQASASLARDWTGLCWLRIAGTPVPGVALASTTPDDKAVLTVVSTDRRTGANRFLRAHASTTGTETRVQWDEPPPTQDETSFAFDLNGKLLAMSSASLSDKVEARTKTASGPAGHAETRVRPFTAAERAWLQSKSGIPSR